MITYTPKRPREKEDHEPDGITSHGKKKHRSLPLRASSQTNSSFPFLKSDQNAPQVGVSSLTPAESSEDDNDHGHRGDNPRSCLMEAEYQQAQSVLSAARYGTEMDVDNGNNVGVDFVDESCNDRSQQSPIPPRVIYRSLTISEQQTTRLALETCPSAVDSTENMEHRNGAYRTRRDALDDLYNDRNTAWWRDQHLPSPVSDGDAMAISSKDSASDADMAYTMSRPASPSSGQMSGMYKSMRDSNPSPGTITGGETSPKKLTFSMGYRSDCEKCRRKVPGHYSHIIRC
ncbi:uncharacterized protein BO66DRAFT_429636 [Aspergillus aculeatinus CBS 121060]|uniref:Uncharacterized protein n=1 Tax=Aspergillus aculeatinus CBS 121060 TaxID=1448322 RepID=A0ACD1H5X8_9EURO|nr:hypothetical protein BO66DRAFT_429636 [Aspergillus aculeatinus CBS 121060]RAH68993.1 hypothetical protein BO66DRAFT_429636 [Aspergillus aculeatinus CBS 121060]